MLLNGRSKGFNTTKNSKDNLDIAQIKKGIIEQTIEIGIGAMSIEGLVKSVKDVKSLQA